MRLSTVLAAAILALAAAGPAAAQSAAPSAETAKPAETKAKSTKAAKREQPAPAIVDINTASVKELDTLPGIGKARAERIVKGRPYKGRDDLLEKKIVPKGVYEKIKDRIVAKQS